MSLAILSKKTRVLRTSNSINITNTNKINSGLTFSSFAKQYYNCCNSDKTINTCVDIRSVGEIIHKRLVKCSNRENDPYRDLSCNPGSLCVDSNIVKNTGIDTISDYLNNVYKEDCLFDYSCIDEVIDENVVIESEYNIIYGTEGDDVLRGTEGDDIIYGFGGDDIIYGFGGDDVLYGGEGDDVLYGGEGDDVLYGGEGDDVLYGGEGNDVLYGGEGRNFIYAGDGDVIYNIDEDDTVIGTGNFKKYDVDGNLI